MLQTLSAYVLIFFGVFIEGEFTFISACVAAHHHHLELIPTILIGFTATLCSDWLYFFIGRKQGMHWIHSKSHLAGRIKKAEELLSRRRYLVLLSYRFFYGFRIVIPVMLGAVQTQTTTFLLFSFIGTILWTTVIAALGLILGETILQYLHHIEGVEFYVIGILIAVGIIVEIIKRYLSQKKMASHQP